MTIESRSKGFTTIPYGKLGIIALPGCEEMAEKIDKYIVKWRLESEDEHKSSISFDGYFKDSYIVDVSLPRFGTGEGKAVIDQSVRGYDIFVLADVFNYGVTYEMYGHTVPMSPDEHFANLKRIIAAIGGKAHRITVIMPMLYEGRQHKRSSRESLDCAIALQELCSLMGVDNVLTFDAHDPRVQNAIPLRGFENVSSGYQIIKSLLNTVENLKIDSKSLMVISPDEGGMGRGIYYATVLGVELGMFYKRRDYSKIVNGRNPILAHEYLGAEVEGKDVLVIDDMISSGESILEVAGKLKDLKAKRIFLCVSFGLFCNGLEMFDNAYKDGIFHKVFTTNLVYRSPELKQREWFVEVEMSKYISYIIDALNHDSSVSKLLSPSERINALLERKGLKQKS
ncbi:MAG: ribose-phosphate pyrophosphokinase [Oscillospiraceae bacterium]|jgi:ribose-phosphate pyrophosphokinase|nr:ribose-phosphate pyrophosphokinase [Oscillospiraceae bacterium]